MRSQIRDILRSLLVALCLILPASSHGSSGGFVLFAPKADVEAAFGEKLNDSLDDMIHASGKDFDYLHYVYNSVGTKRKLFIACYTFTSTAAARRDFRRITTAPWSTPVRVLGHTARYFPRGREQEHVDANLAILLTNEIIVVKVDNMVATDSTRRKLERVALLVLNPKLRGHI